MTLESTWVYAHCPGFGDHSCISGERKNSGTQCGDIIGQVLHISMTTTHQMLILTLDSGLVCMLKHIRLKNRSDKADKPKLKLTIKTGTAGTHSHDRIVSPNRSDNTFQVLSLLNTYSSSFFQIPKVVKADSPTSNRKDRSPRY